MQNAYDSMKGAVKTGRFARGMGLAVFGLLGLVGGFAPLALHSDDASSATTNAAAPAQPAPQPVKGANGQMYLIPAGIYPLIKTEGDGIDAMSAQIDKQQAAVDADAADYKQQAAQYKDLGDEIDSERKTLDSTNSSAVDAFNAKVDSYNRQGTALEQRRVAVNNEETDLQTKIDAFNAKVNDFNAELVRVGTPVKN
jgi:uncharacterized protein YukE